MSIKYTKHAFIDACINQLKFTIMAKTIDTTACSDWHRSWGMGTNKLGKLTKIGETKYSWKGKAQGRHNQILRKTWSSEFDFIDGQVINATDSLPDSRDIKDAIAILG